jgi:uncharacterized protein (TIGR03435 family)
MTSMRVLCCTLMLAPVCWICLAQEYDPSVHFEVASVRPMGQGQIGRASGGPGTNDPETVNYEAARMETLIRGAFDIEPYQLDGPSWIDSERYAINAKVPSGATRDQFRQMIVNLLVERFGLVFHRAAKEIPAYAITVAKGGSKLMPTTHNDQFGKFQCSSTDRETMKCELTQTSIGVLTNRIEILLRPGKLDAPVMDHTGISGKFDFNLEFPVITSTSDLIDIATNLSDALRKRVGLQLESIKLSFPVLVIDHLERNPTPN